LLRKALLPTCRFAPSDVNDGDSASKVEAKGRVETLLARVLLLDMTELEENAADVQQNEARIAAVHARAIIIVPTSFLFGYVLHN
jgi:hypothetical protein